jgi:hypothetical protein
MSLISPWKGGEAKELFFFFSTKAQRTLFWSLGPELPSYPEEMFIVAQAGTQPWLPICWVCPWAKSQKTSLHLSISSCKMGPNNPGFWGYLTAPCVV